MELVEIVVQGLQGARELVRTPFAAGVTVLPAGPRERLTVRLVLDLLYPKGTEPTLADLDEPVEGAQSRVAVTVQGRDGQRYRLLLDVKSGRRALQRLHADKAEVITSSSNEIAQAVTATIGFPQEDVLRGLFLTTREDLPSRRAKAAPGPGAAAGATGAAASGGKAEKPLPPGFEQTNPGVAAKPLPPGFSDEGPPLGGGAGGFGAAAFFGGDPASSMAAARGGRTDEQLKARIAELDDILRTQGSVKELEFEIDGLQKKVFEYEARLKPLVTLKRSVQQAEEQMRRYAAIEGVPGDLVERGERLRKIRAEHDRDVARLEEERRVLLESARTLDRRGRQRPMDVAQRDPLVKYGVAAGAAAIALGVVGAVIDSPLQWLALLDIPALGVATVGGVRVLSSLEEGERTRRKLDRLDAEKKRLDERFKIDEEMLTSLLDKHGFTLEQLPDLEQQLRARDEARNLHERASAALAEAQQGGDVAVLEKEQAEVQARVRVLEDKLTMASAGFSSTADVQHERDELVALLAGGIAQKATSAPLADMTGEDMPIPTAERAAYSGSAAGAPIPERALNEDLGKRLLELATDLLLVPVEEVAAMVQGRAAQILAALSDNRLRTVRFGAKGEVSVVDAADDTVAFGALPGFDRDLVWLAIKISLVEILVRRDRLPVVFDRTLDFLADAKGPMLQKMLTFLAASTQVVSISEKPALGGRAS